MPLLRSEDWDVPVVDLKKLRSCDEAGVAIASRSEAKKAIDDGKRKEACAVVVLAALPELAGQAGQMCSVVVRRGTRIETTTGTVFQLGEKKVSSKMTFNRVAMPDAGEPDVQRLSVCVPRRYTTATEWGEATANLRAYLGQFAAEQGVSRGDVIITGVETRGRAEDPARSLGALIRVNAEQARRLEATSGHRGVFVVPKKDAGPVVWLSAETTLADAKALAGRVAAKGVSGDGGKKGNTMKGGKGGKNVNIEAATVPAGFKPTSALEATEVEQLRAQLNEALRRIEDLTKRLAEMQTKQAGARQSTLAGFVSSTAK
ncbi:hypothetical protein DIPPA_27329 [Diplonema papillatum]|nr:hypothetical protein DIPPA_27329 [Diplonema papillatum]